MAIAAHVVVAQVCNATTVVAAHVQAVMVGEVVATLDTDRSIVAVACTTRRATLDV